MFFCLVYQPVSGQRIGKDILPASSLDSACFVSLVEEHSGAQVLSYIGNASQMQVDVPSSSSDSSDSSS